MSGWTQKLLQDVLYCFETNIGAASAWIRIGELQAQDIACAPYNTDSFKAVLKEIQEAHYQ